MARRSKCVLEFSPECVGNRRPSGSGLVCSPVPRQMEHRGFKCNLYYFKPNYFILIVFVLAVGFLLNPLAIISALV